MENSNKEKQIEEMAREIVRNIGKHCEDVPFATMRDIDAECGLCTVNVPSCAFCKIARSLYATGYRKQSDDLVSIETVKKWLYVIAINNVGCVLDGDFSVYCEEIVSRLDGLKRFAEEMKGGE